MRTLKYYYHVGWQKRPRIGSIEIEQPLKGSTGIFENRLDLSGRSSVEYQQEEGPASWRTLYVSLKQEVIFGSIQRRLLRPKRNVAGGSLLFCYQVDFRHVTKRDRERHSMNTKIYLWKLLVEVDACQRGFSQVASLGEVSSCNIVVKMRNIVFHVQLVCIYESYLSLVPLPSPYKNHQNNVNTL